MPVVLPSSFRPEIERPHGQNPLLWFCEIELVRPVKIGPTTFPRSIFRVCNHTAQVAWPVSDPLSATWYPYNFTFTPIEQNQEGDLPQIDLSVDNTSRTLMRYLHNGDGLEGNYCWLYLVPANALAIAYPNHEYQLWQFQIAGARASDEAVTFRLERANFFSKLSPQDRYVAARCRWEYGSIECGYVINAAAGFLTCPKTVDACAERGEDHRTRGLPVFHPGRFGGFPGIPKQR